MNKEQEEVIKKRIAELKEWQADLPEDQNFEGLIAKFEELLKE